MPFRRLPDSDVKRLAFLVYVKYMMNNVPAPQWPYTADTVTWFNTFFPTFKSAMASRGVQTGIRTDLTPQEQAAFDLAAKWISHFFQAFNHAIERGEPGFLAGQRGYFDIDTTDGSIPEIITETDLVFWGDKAIGGEADRVAALHPAVLWPAIADVEAKYNLFTSKNVAQSLQDVTVNTSEASVASKRAEADRLILKMCNETETKYDEGNAPDKRRLAAIWGVPYSNRPGEESEPILVTFLPGEAKVVPGVLVDEVFDIEFFEGITAVGAKLVTDPDDEMPPAQLTTIAIAEVKVVSTDELGDVETQHFLKLINLDNTNPGSIRLRRL